VIAAAFILMCTVLGALWRYAKGGAASPLASWTFAPMTAITVTPLALVAPWWAALVAWAAFAGMSAAFLLVRADNGGNGDPLGRFSEFGRGYWIADRYRQKWHAALGEPWLGGSWFGCWAAAFCAAANVMTGGATL